MLISLVRGGGAIGEVTVPVRRGPARQTALHAYGPLEVLLLLQKRLLVLCQVGFLHYYVRFHFLVRNQLL
jgi:hypothetical protein